VLESGVDINRYIPPVSRAYSRVFRLLSMFVPHPWALTITGQYYKSHNSPFPSRSVDNAGAKGSKFKLMFSEYNRKLL